jgi:general secretion pathway protein G
MVAPTPIRRVLASLDVLSRSERRNRVVGKPDSRFKGAPRRECGFTLIELVIVMTIISLLAAIAVPMYVQSVRNAREAVLKEDLRTLRSAIDSYTVDKQKAPQTLEDLVQAGYLKSMPVDPFTHRSDTWVPAQDDTLASLDQTEAGINDVHSGAPGGAADGSSYASW